MLGFPTKKIETFDGVTLERFTITMTFDKEIAPIEIKRISDFEEVIKEEYPVTPKITLLPKNIQSVRLQPLTFGIADSDNKIVLGSNYLLFQFTKYTYWEAELKKIMSVIDAMVDTLKKSVELPNIADINLTYVDNFEIEGGEDFRLDNYFAVQL
ncbi:MAG: TIGR04255 family protein, partial [Candidatus Odinarchaeota archaeon]